MKRLAKVIVVLSAAVIAGCESQPRAGDLSRAVDDYTMQRYSSANEKSVHVMNTARSPQREDAAYLAALCSYQMGHVDEAERRLMVAVQSSQPETVAKAKAMLGQVRLDQKRYREAAIFFTDAARNLEGDDAQRATYYAGLAYRHAGDANEAKKHLGNGAPPAPPAPVVSKANGASGSRFALQVGAFTEKKRAEQAADSARALAKAADLGDVRIIPGRDARGHQVFLVHIGSFPTREAAAAARTKAGRLNYIVALAAP